MSRTRDTFLERINQVNYSFFRSRRQAVVAAFAGSLCTGCLVLLPNFTLESTKSFLEAKRGATSVAPSQKLRCLFETAKSDLGYSKSDSRAIRIFSLENQSSEVFGSVKPAGCKAIVGLPVFLNADNAEQVTVDRKLSPGLQKEEEEFGIAKYKEVSLFSDSAKLYVIGEGLLFAKDPIHYFSTAIVSSLCFLGTIVFASLMIRYSRLKQLSFLHRALAYVSSGTTVSISAPFLSNAAKDLIYQNMVVNNLSEEYIDGGIEFYEKLMQRNEISYDLFSHPWHYIVDKQFLTLVCERRLDALRGRKGELTRS